MYFTYSGQVFEGSFFSYFACKYVFWGKIQIHQNTPKYMQNTLKYNKYTDHVRVQRSPYSGAKVLDPWGRRIVRLQVNLSGEGDRARVQRPPRRRSSGIEMMIEWRALVEDRRSNCQTILGSRRRTLGLAKQIRI